MDTREIEDYTLIADGSGVDYEAFEEAFEVAIRAIRKHQADPQNPDHEAEVWVNYTDGTSDLAFNGLSYSSPPSVGVQS